MNVQLQFSRFAETYSDHNVIQGQVVTKLLEDLDGEQPRRILDLGCGNGALYHALTWQPEHFLGVDFAPRMLELHPKGDHIECIYGDFNDPNLFEHLQFLDFDRIISASALQWAEDLDRTFSMIASLKSAVSLALFTSNTFKTLFQTAGLEAILNDVETVQKIAKHYFNADFEVVAYRLEFASMREMFRYIKRSGVSAGRNVLSYKAMKRLMATYPLKYLEFEVLFIRT